MNIKEKDSLYIAGTYARFDVEIVKGKGALLYDDNGKEYIDMGSGIAVNTLGVAPVEGDLVVARNLLQGVFRRLRRSSGLGGAGLFRYTAGQHHKQRQHQTKRADDHLFQIGYLTFKCLFFAANIIANAKQKVNCGAQRNPGL